MKLNPENEILAAALSKRLDACFCDDVGQLHECKRCLKIRELLDLMAQEAPAKPVEDALPPEFVELHFKAAVAEMHKRYQDAFDRMMKAQGRLPRAISLGAVGPNLHSEITAVEREHEQVRDDLIILVGGLLGRLGDHTNAAARRKAFELVRDAGVTWVKPQS